MSVASEEESYFVGILDFSYSCNSGSISTFKVIA